MSSLDPVVAQVLPFLKFGEVSALTPESWRGFLLALARAPNNPPAPPVAEVFDATVPGPGHSIPVRVYRPTPAPSPTVLYFHGGGWVGGDLDTHDALARVLALDLGCCVVAVDFRKPPEHPFPAAFDDASSAVRHVAANLSAFGGAGQPLAVAGDSAGANLAAAVALACRENGPALAAQLLLYPVTDVAGGWADPSVNAAWPSRSEHAEGYFVTTPLSRWCAQHYLSGADGKDPRASPLRAQSVTGVAPAVVATAQFDPCRDEGKAYAQKLREAGVPVSEHLGAGLIHAYFAFEAASPAAGAEARAVRAAFKALLKR